MFILKLVAVLGALCVRGVFGEQTFEEYETFPAPLSTLIMKSGQELGLPMKLLKMDDFVVYDLRIPMQIWDINVKLDHSECRDLESVDLLVSNSTRVEKMSPIINISCDNADYEDQLVKFEWKNVAFARIVRIQFNSRKKGDPATVRSIAFNTKESPMKRIIDPPITNRVAKDKKYYLFDERYLRKITLRMDLDYDFHKTNEFPVLEVLVVHTAEISPNYATVHLKAIPHRNSFEAVFSTSFKTHSMRIRNHLNVTKVFLFAPGRYHKLRETLTGNIKLQSKERIIRIDFPKIPKDVEFKAFISYPENGRTKLIPIYSRSPQIETHIYADTITINGDNSQLSNFVLFTSPCNEIRCLNKGVCLVRSDFTEGFGCECRKDFAGALCELANRHYCKDLSDTQVSFDKDSYFALESVIYECANGRTPRRKLICVEKGLFDQFEEIYVLPKDLC